ncbi:MAG: hypothetical protein JNM27_11470 [Leptospirales bacterium]|nr:hypothetical protein [Leptospirales bacterium]
MNQYYVATDAILLLASELDTRNRLISQMEQLLDAGDTFVTTSFSFSEALRVFEAKSSVPRFKTFLWRLRPLFETILDFAEEDLERGQGFMETNSLPFRQAMEAAVVLNRGLAGILSASDKFDSLESIRRIPFAL